VLKRTTGQWLDRSMRSVDIKFSQRSAKPGESISGIVIVNTEKAFDFNRIVLKVKGKEKTEMGSGDSKITDEYIHLSRKFELCDVTEVSVGRSEFPFEFKLNDNLPPTYSGYNGFIEYSVEAVIEMNWVIDPKITRRFRVLPNQPPYLSEPDGYNPMNRDIGILHTEIQSDIIRIRKGIPVRFMVEEHSRVVGVRLEIRRRENAKCGGRKDQHDVTISRKYIPLTTGEFYRWREEIVGEGWKRVPFQSKLLRTSYFLRVVLEMKWDFDPDVTYQIKVSGKEREEEVEDILDTIGFDLGFN
jgi:hypothetical protein